jgi:Phage major capsid protein E
MLRVRPRGLREDSSRFCTPPAGLYPRLSTHPRLSVGPGRSARSAELADFEILIEFRRQLFSPLSDLNVSSHKGQATRPCGQCRIRLPFGCRRMFHRLGGIVVLLLDLAQDGIRSVRLLQSYSSRPKSLKLLRLMSGLIDSRQCCCRPGPCRHSQGCQGQEHRGPRRHRRRNHGNRPCPGRPGGATAHVPDPHPGLAKCAALLPHSALGWIGPTTIGLPRYAKQAGDQQFARWVMLHVQSNPLPICTRPRVLIKGKRT